MMKQLISRLTKKTKIRFKSKGFERGKENHTIIDYSQCESNWGKE